MSAAEVLDALRAAGAQVGVDDGHLRVLVETGTVPAELRARAVADRDGILALLVAEDEQNERTGSDMEDGVTDVDAIVERVLALSQEERSAWRREIIHAAVWAAAGKRNDPHLLADLRVLRRVEAAGACLRCGNACPTDGRFWCDGCATRYAKVTKGTR